MAIQTPCQTNGALFKTFINGSGLNVYVSFGKIIDMSDKEAEILEVNIHNALELVLAPYWRNDEKNNRS